MNAVADCAEVLLLIVLVLLFFQECCCWILFVALQVHASLFALHSSVVFGSWMFSFALQSYVVSGAKIKFIVNGAGMLMFASQLWFW